MSRSLSLISCRLSCKIPALSARAFASPFSARPAAAAARSIWPRVSRASFASLHFVLKKEAPSLLSLTFHDCASICAWERSCSRCMVAARGGSTSYGRRLRPPFLIQFEAGAVLGSRGNCCWDAISRSLFGSQIACCLQFKHLGVKSAKPHQFFVFSRHGNSSVFKCKNLIRIFYGRDSARNDLPRFP